MKVLLCSKLSRPWFFIWFWGISIYLLIKAIRRYLELKALQFEFDREIDNSVITMYLTSIIIAISAGICCVTCVIFRTGNYANDSVKFGSKLLDFKTLQIRFHREQIGNQKRPNNVEYSSGFATRLKNHFPAFFSCFYFVMSFAFFFMLPYLDSEGIRLDFETPDRIWSTNLDIIFSPFNNFEAKNYIKPVTPEFANLCISMLVHMFSYASIFWRFNKLFSFTFSIIIFLNGLVFILDVALVEMLIKISRNSNFLSPSLKLEFHWLPLLNVMSFMSYVLMLMLQQSMFEYGFNRLRDVLMSRHSNDMVNDNCATYNNSSNVSIKLRYVWKQLCIDSWNGTMLPFLIGVTAGFCSILIKLPYVYKSLKIIYAQTHLSIILFNVAFSTSFMTIIVILWILLILKSNWSIKNYPDQIATLNGDCPLLYTSKPNSDIHTIPVYASVNRHPSLSPPVDQEPHFPIFCDKMATQWRYSCSPASCAPNDSNSNSDVTVSGKNQDIGGAKKNYIYLSRINPTIDSPNYNQGIYSQLVKLTPQLSMTENPLQTDSVNAQQAMSNDVSDHSSNQTVHIIAPASIEIGRRTIDRTSLRNRPEVGNDINGTEYFNIIANNTAPLLPRQMYMAAPSTSTDAESNNLCTQV